MYDDLLRIADSVGEREGWDFSRVRFSRDPIPWDYETITPRFLRLDDIVLDIGTGGGERLLQLADHLGEAIGIDHDPIMIETAKQNLTEADQADIADKVTFEVMNAEALSFADETFDTVLSRQAPVDTSEVLRVLRPGGLFITQQIGPWNTQNILQTFGYQPEHDASITEHYTQKFRKAGCKVLARGAYDVAYYFEDVESLIFWMKAVPVPPDFDITRHAPQVQKIIDQFRTPHGIKTNEHRELLIAQKPR